MSTISIITRLAKLSDTDWSIWRVMARLSISGNLDNDDRPTLLGYNAMQRWHDPAGGRTWWLVTMRPLDTRHNVTVSGPLIGTIFKWDIETYPELLSYCPQSPLKHSPVPARQFMFHSILKCIMNLYKRESLLFCYVFFYSSIILLGSKTWELFPWSVNF